ncbi:SIS domain-containing protein [Micromonospora carbonacea]|uniref:Glutamine--fructose-6-phosphate transaminase n=1 Tax=Micromonospora carbonacea TaxID=47853 RepID=A0A1C4US78_9ACTN|nr:MULTISPECIES: SIS domain-containing protein [Micromonospora]MDG4815250.1 SIS domain-containing protein [Micromonospora sp. WMMD956]WFE61567.1 SIS domain-containing protein [Micromonospora sp. WMMD712]SCE74508.1 glutamine--fructose-6-phosphate transaminase [Micromonospora carbonacea]
MAADISEQPAGYERLLSAEHAGAIARVAAVVAQRRPRHVVFTARGTSDHAALYAAYLTEIRLGLPAGLASPSAVTLFGARPDLSDALVVGVSQSGGSPDLAEVLRAARASGALTLAVTNNPDSPLAGIAELNVDIAAGAERAVAATKTYTAELLALLLLVEGVRAGDGALPAAERAALAALPELAARTLDDPTPAQLAPRYRFAAQLVTTGRGYAYPTAREAALKLMETSYLPALAFSGADLLHGPLAMTDPDVPVLAVVGSGPGGRSMGEVLPRLGERRADVVVVGSADVEGATRMAVPEVDERYAPLLDILPLQRLALALALARGEDPDAPRGLKKVTATM